MMIQEVPWLDPMEVHLEEVMMMEASVTLDLMREDP